MRTCRFPNETTTATLVGGIVNALKNLSPDEIAGNLAVVEPGRVRLRSKTE